MTTQEATKGPANQCVKAAEKYLKERLVELGHQDIANNDMMMFFRVKKMSFSDRENYWEYWLDAGTLQSKFLLWETVNVVPHEGGFAVKQELSDTPQKGTPRIR